MSRTLWLRTLATVAVATVVMISKLSYGALLLNYQFETVDGSPPSGQTTPDSSGSFTSTPGTINAVLGYGTQTPGIDFPNLIPGPVTNFAAGVASRNPDMAMNFPGSPASGTITNNFTRVEIADASSGALDATFSNFTVALWLNPSSTTRDRFAIGKLGSSGQRGWQISSPNTTSDLVIDYFDAAGSTVSRSLKVAGALPLNTWTHVIFAFDGTNQTEAVYINNVLQTVDSTASTTTIPLVLNGSNSAPFRTGHRGGAQSSVAGWAGGIDDVVIYNDTLAFSETGSQTGTGSLLVTVPEPISAMLALIGLVSATFARKRRK